jgi:hypothetical protein
MNSVLAKRGNKTWHGRKFGTHVPTERCWLAKGITGKQETEKQSNEKVLSL